MPSDKVTDAATHRIRAEQAAKWLDYYRHGKTLKFARICLSPGCHAVYKLSGKAYVALPGHPKLAESIEVSSFKALMESYVRKAQPRR